MERVDERTDPDATRKPPEDERRDEPERGPRGLLDDALAESARLAYLLTADRDLAERLARRAVERCGGRFAHLRGPDRFVRAVRRETVTLVSLHERRFGPPAEPDDPWPVPLDLPVRDRAAVLLRYVSGLSEDETAEALRCRVQTARAAEARGLARLAEREAGDSPS